jgi:DNA replication licensing factor MCM3
MEEGTPIRESGAQSLGVGLEADVDANKPTEVYEKFNVMLHSGVTITTGRGSGRKVEVVSIPFIKKYIQYAKQRIKPVLTQGAAEHISSTYSSLRNDEMEGNQRKTSPMTARTLETLIRLSTAHAKARLSNRVETKDAEVAEQILRFALFKEIVEDERRKRRKRTHRPDTDAMSTDSGSDSSDNDEGDERPRQGTPRTNGPRTRRNPGAANGTTDTNGATNDDEEEDNDDLYTVTPRTNRTRTQRTNGTASQSQSQSRFSPASSHPASQLLPSSTQADNSQATTGAVSEEVSARRIQTFQTALGQLIDTPLFANDAADEEPLVAAVNARLSGPEEFDDDEAKQVLEVLSERNKIM